MFRSVFEDQLLVDDREPFFSVKLFGYVFHFLLPKVAFYQQAVVLAVIQIALTCILSFITYQLVVAFNNKKREQKQQQQQQKQVSHNNSTTTATTPSPSQGKNVVESSSSSSPSSSSLLLRQSKTKTTISAILRHCFCYFVIFPFCFWIPFRMIDYFDIRNGASRLACTFIPLNYPFRCIEALHDFTPKAATISWDAFMKHAGFNMIPVYSKQNNGQMIQLTWRGLYQCFVQYVYGLTIICLLYSICLPMIDTTDTTTGAAVSSDTTTTTSNHYDDPLISSSWQNNGTFSSSFSSLSEHEQQWHDNHSENNGYAPDIFVTFDLKQWKQSYLLALLVNLSMFYGFHGYGMIPTLLGRVLFELRLSDWPMFKSTSPSDFWGRKWNNLVHYALKQGIYKPVRSLTKSKLFATLSAFVVSGILHEYLWLILFYKNSHQQQEESLAAFTDDGSCYNNHNNNNGYYTPGKQLLFFGWNALVILFEYTVGAQIIKQIVKFLGEKTRNATKKQPNNNDKTSHNNDDTIGNYIPKPVLATLVIITALPIGHLFTADFLKSGYFRAMQMGIPLITVESS